MALTVANTHPFAQALAFSNLRARLVTVTFDNSYANPGGESFTPAMVGMSEILAVFPSVRDAGAGAGRVVQYDKANNALSVFEDGATVSGALDETPNATDLSTLIVDCLVLGV